MAEFPLDILLDGIAIVDELTAGVQDTCFIQQFSGESMSGDQTYGTSKSFKAIVDLTSKQVNKDGQFVTTGGTVTVLNADSITDLGVVTNPPRTEPVDTRDIILLPDGTTAPILSTPGSIINPDTHQGLILSITLGARSNAR